MSKYDHLTHDELTRLLEARDRRDATRFGLVWESNEIERDKAINADFVALDLDAAVSTPAEPPEGGWGNLIIEGDNFDALRYLRMTHGGRVKCILIDPPYNTGVKDFVYNDNFIDRNDSWRFSTWIEFLYQRLIIARELLTEDGVILVCINDESRAKLELLLDKVMPGRRVGSFVWRTRSGANDSKEYFRSIDHEYVLCYANPGFTFAGKKKTNEAYSNEDNDKRGAWCNDNLVKAHNYKQRPNTFYPLLNPESEIWYAADPDNVWRFASERRLKKGQQLRSKTMEQIIREKKVLWPKEERTVCYRTKDELVAAIQDGSAPRNLRLGNTSEEKVFWDKELEFWVSKTIGYGKPRYKRHLSEVKRSEKPFSSWLMPASLKKEEREEIDLEGIETAVVGGTSDGTSLVQEILGNKDFDYPKPLSLIQAFVRQTTSDDDLVLDFFAGSGTTAHAVLAQNEEDGGERRFILISSTEANKDENEKNVCRDICARRMRRVIDGYNVPMRNGTKEVPGLAGDFAYLRCRRIAPGHLLDIEHEQVWTALQMIHFETLKSYTAADFLIAGDEGAKLIYVPRFAKALVPALREAVKDCAAAVIYSWQPETLRQHIRAGMCSTKPSRKAWHAALD
jgi:adenine-specific DNA-methyltransferase